MGFRMGFGNLVCMVCGNPAERHHIKTRGSGGTDDDWNILALCRLCHIKIHQIGNYKFCEKYPKILRELKKKGWIFIGRKLRRE